MMVTVVFNQGNLCIYQYVRGLPVSHCKFLIAFTDEDAVETYCKQNKLKIKQWIF